MPRVVTVIDSVARAICELYLIRCRVDYPVFRRFERYNVIFFNHCLHHFFPGYRDPEGLNLFCVLKCLQPRRNSIPCISRIEALASFCIAMRAFHVALPMYHAPPLPGGNLSPVPSAFAFLIAATLRILRRARGLQRRHVLRLFLSHQPECNIRTFFD